MGQETVFEILHRQAEKDPSIDVLWLYGSRAKGTADIHSDYDLAIAFHTVESEEHSYRTDTLAYEWSCLTQAKISVVDINRIPTPLAYSVINEGRLILVKNSLRLHSEQSRIWSLWEEYRYEYIKNRA